MESALRHCRNRLQLSQREFAERLGVALKTYRTWESRRRPVPADVSLAHACSVTVQTTGTWLRIYSSERPQTALARPSSTGESLFALST
jgi:transcriptional regulator with XRE-family HTH domain